MRSLPCDIWENSLAGRVDSYGKGPEEIPCLVCLKKIKDCTVAGEGAQSGDNGGPVIRLSQAIIVTCVFAQSARDFGRASAEYKSNMI